MSDVRILTGRDRLRSDDPDEALSKQMQIIDAAIGKLIAARSAIESMPDNPTWRDVAEYAHLIDALRRADLAH